MSLYSTFGGQGKLDIFQYLNFFVSFISLFYIFSATRNFHLELILAPLVDRSSSVSEHRGPFEKLTFYSLHLWKQDLY